MQFEDVLNYLDQMVGLELLPLNETNDPLVILNVDHNKRRYTVEKTSSTNKRTRAFNELNKIWDDLNLKGFVSVDQALNGAGSSRHQPETIFANLPNIEHFKYEKKKHLYLRAENSHELGTLKEVTAAESKELKKRIDHYKDFDISLFHSEHNRIVSTLRSNLANTFIKYPGESDVESIETALNELDELQEKLAVSVVTLESNDFVEEEQSMSGRNYKEDEEDEEYQEFFGKAKFGEESSQYLTATRISQVTPTVSLLFDRINHNEIDLQPEFQRKDRIWPLKDKARLIESVLLGLPIPVFYFAENSNSYDELDWIVIDGLQRTTTLYDYMAGHFELKYLDRRADLNGMSFRDLPRKEQRRIREYQIQGHLIQVSSESDAMVRELFQRINTSGKNLSYQEIRSALYPGSANRFLKYIANSSEFINSTPLNINPERMLDLEFILRASSYIYLGYENFNYSKYDDFLCQTLKELNRFNFNKHNNGSDDVFLKLERELKNAFVIVQTIFGDAGYRKEPKGKMNKSLFELLVSVFALMTPKQREIITSESNSSDIRHKFYEMINSDSTKYANWNSEAFESQSRGFDYSISNSTGKYVTIKYRFESFINMINSVAGINFTFKPLKEKYNDN
ncbi:DUF262 domain-containing protein [Aliivibrio fischeri]|uniref:DUF262 domain-containing protein n=1 Tax=Aliivibrio fischeri TaxID=668 RepID=UPI0012DAB741|nr:DUF262 domain-containing protein [Aliivibrio fischeri]MUK70326.1 DUF262 domain-containing protein [Aliivibrio fischeri]MUK72010.1 DUF262 domain-containing protein [Aliivibrio fischeri]